LNQFTTAPIAVESGLTFKSVAVGWQHTCALTTDGSAHCWGDNRYGQLGVGTTDTLIHAVPLAVLGNFKFEQLSLGGFYSCGVTTTHQALCWGLNATGALGDGTKTDRATPTPVAGAFKFKEVAASTGFGTGGVEVSVDIPGGVAHTCAINEAGAPYCWGLNASGQLGDGTFTDRLAPVAVLSSLEVTHIGLGGAHTCGIRVGDIKTGWLGSHEFQTGIYLQPRLRVDTVDRYANDGFQIEEVVLRNPADLSAGTIPFHRRAVIPAVFFTLPLLAQLPEGAGRAELAGDFVAAVEELFG
jgi:alpha-tubulin suppressor-like RCC1 family protein